MNYLAFLDVLRTQLIAYRTVGSKSQGVFGLPTVHVIIIILQVHIQQYLHYSVLYMYFQHQKHSDCVRNITMQSMSTSMGMQCTVLNLKQVLLLLMVPLVFLDFHCITNVNSDLIESYWSYKLYYYIIPHVLVHSITISHMGRTEKTHKDRVAFQF